jgi:diacylglycerol O-acyltransferase / wax synthase
MERLTGIDASFLYMETPSLHMHVSMAAVFDPSTVPGGYSWEKVQRLVGSRLSLAPIFRRRLVEVPFRLDHPYWVEDATFDLDYHLRRAALPAPGGMTELADFVGDVCSRQLDRSKPLWEMYLVEGLENGNIAIVSKIHHCTIDGVSGSELLAQLFDLEAHPTGKPDEVTAPGAEHVPSDIELLRRAVVSRLMRPVGMTKLVFRTGKAVLNVRRVRGESSTGHAALPLTTPRTSLNAAITPHRKVAFSSIALDDVKRIKNAMETTVNDVVLAVCTGALRRYLTESGELPDDPLVATVPVSVHPTASTRGGSNKISAMWVGLPCQLDDPVKRLLTIRDSTKGAKKEHNALGADLLLDWTEHATPNLFSSAARAYSRLKLADRHRPIHSLVISNVPGPDFPLYLAGAEMVAGFPLGPVMDGAGLNITVMSYRGVLNWGLMACAESVPTVRAMATYIPDALQELLLAAGLEPATPIGVAPAGSASPAKSGASSSRRAAASSRKTPGRTTSRSKTGSASSGRQTKESVSSS